MSEYAITELTEGMSASMTKTVTETDVVLYAGITGDFNPAHIDEEYAQASAFKGRIAHGMLSAGFISATLGMKLPGQGCVYLSQNLKFKSPVKIGDTVKTTVTITSVNVNRKVIKLDTVCRVGETVVIAGDCMMMKS
ncbi:MAG: MaoC family dehydratase [Cycloclasticus sp.]